MTHAQDVVTAYGGVVVTTLFGSLQLNELSHDVTRLKAFIADRESAYPEGQEDAEDEELTELRTQLRSVKNEYKESSARYASASFCIHEHSALSCMATTLSPGSKYLCLISDAFMPGDLGGVCNLCCIICCSCSSVGTPAQLWGNVLRKFSSH
jgi:hypothetical protein